MFVTTPAPFKIVQTPGLIVMLSESDTSFRQIFMDGRPPPADPQPSWIGFVIGRWDGDTLVVEPTASTIAASSTRWATVTAARCVSPSATPARHRPMDVQFTFDDPGTFTRPITSG